MKSPIYATGHRCFRGLVILLTFCFLLLLSRGFVTSGDDWFFSAQNPDEGFREAVKEGYDCAARHYIGINGRILGNAFSRFFGSNDTLRELGRCTIMLVILLQICRLAKIRTGVEYLAALLLFVALPSDLYAQSYAWAAGFFNYVPPIMMLLAYMFRAERILRGEKDKPLSGVGMFLLAFFAQFFVENMTIGLCLLCVGVLVWDLISHRRISWSLIGALLGAVVGCAIMFSAPGYAKINSDGYRQIGTSLEELMAVIQTNFMTVTMYLTERNFLVMVPLTGLAMLALAGEKPEQSGIQRLKFAAILLLMVCPVYFYANYQILGKMDYVPWVRTFRFALDVLANLLYLLAVLAAAVLGIREPGRRTRGILCIAAVPMILAPLMVVNPIGPRCMYIPYMLLVCLVLAFGADLLERCPAGWIREIRIPVALTVAAVLGMYLWLSVWNSHCEKIRIARIEEAMAQKAESVELPSYPYPDYVHYGNGSAICYYYYYETTGDLKFVYHDFEDWYGR